MNATGGDTADHGDKGDGPGPEGSAYDAAQNAGAHGRAEQQEKTYDRQSAAKPDRR